jgi:hypothetical protein
LRRAAERPHAVKLVVIEVLCVLDWALTGWWMFLVPALIVGLGLLVASLRS